MRFEKGNTHGNRFTAENQPRGKGRKPKLYSQAQKQYNISFDDFRSVVMKLMQMPMSDLRVFAKDEGQMAWVINIARAIVKDAQAGKVATLSEMTDRFFGKPQISIQTQNETKVEATQVLEIEPGSIPEDILVDIADKLQQRLFEQAIANKADEI